MPDTRSAKADQPKRKGRPRPLPAHVTARNLAIEKQRREEMNDNLLELARLVPALASMQRRNKVLIVNKTIEHLQQQRRMCITAAHDMQNLLAHYQCVISEVNALRIEVAGPGTALVQPLPITEAMQELAEVETQVFGSFPTTCQDHQSGDSSDGRMAQSDVVLDTFDSTSALTTDYANYAFWAPDQLTPTAMTWQDESITGLLELSDLFPASDLQTSSEAMSLENTSTGVELFTTPTLDLPLPHSLNRQMELDVESSILAPTNMDLTSYAGDINTGLEHPIGGIGTSLVAEYLQQDYSETRESR